MASWQVSNQLAQTTAESLSMRRAAQSANDLPDVDSWIHPGFTRIAGAETLLPAVEIFLTGWQTALRRAPSVKSIELDWQVDAPPVLSVPVKPPRVKVLGFAFPESASWEAFAKKTHVAPSKTSKTSRQQQTSSHAGGKSKKSKGRTRVSPPRDIIKREDRLYYLLQPPLESIAATESLRFPFEPFPYQFEGVAFLYSRFAGILADEMGLGKTMQAITTIRMLLCSGEVRNV